MKEKIFRSLNRGYLKKDRVIYKEKTNQILVNFDFSQFKNFHVKNFKAVFYHEYGLPISDYNIHVLYDKSMLNNSIYRLINYLNNNFDWKYSGDKNIFKYKIQPFRTNYKFNGTDIVPAIKVNKNN